ncbi:ribosome silencing factor [Candidatus Poribacteria bacterium]|nr:ribosome silencing factor [Candidatus Poribacteria bacterium]
MVKAAAAVAVSRRARNTVILDLRGLAAFTDFFVICSGISDTQIEGISEGILEELEERWNARPWHREGEREADWILLDYVDFVVHVFLNEKRDYYNLERLWAEARGH